MEAIDQIPYFKPEFMFKSKSPHKPAGFGADEIIHVNDIGKFAELDKIIGWRSMLSNFYSFETVGETEPTPLFELDDSLAGDCLQWKSVEHYFHAQKFKNSHPDYYLEFALDSGSVLSRADGPTTKKAGRKYKMDPVNSQAWDNGGSKNALIRAQYAKFRQNEQLRRVLILTGDAVLKHRATNAGKLVIENDLMQIRTELAAIK